MRPSHYTVAMGLLLAGCGPSAADECQRIYDEARTAELANAYSRRMGQPEEAVPPKPSEIEWEAEHCWQGEPR